MGLTGTAWGFGSIAITLLGTAVLNAAGRTVVWAERAVVGVVLFAAQVALAPALRRGALPHPSRVAGLMTNRRVTGMDAVVFDIGGVLLDWSPNYLYDDLIPDAARREHFLTEIASPEWNHFQDAGRPWAEAVAELTQRYPDHGEWIAAYDTGWLRMCRGIIAGTARLHDEIRAAGVPTYALTNFSVEKWEVAKQTFPELRLFDGEVVSGIEKVTKPDEKIFRILLERYDLDPASTFYTDDVRRNVDGARAVGLTAELFTGADDLRTQLTARGVLRPRT